MTKTLTLAQIEKQFPDEWVLVTNPKTDRTLNVRFGTRRVPQPRPDQIHRKVMELRPRSFAVFFNQTTPDDTIYVLCPQPRGSTAPKG